jgi:hypothetical protein
MYVKQALHSGRPGSSKAVPTDPADSGPMNAHYRQPLPNRRFRRLFPAVLATAALATTSIAGPAAAKTPGHAHARPPKPVTVNAPADAVSRSPRAQPTSET